ncbi:acetoin utilization protein AcuC [Arthrobacter sp. RIT-PI-e]|uniref:acetoin utilization protein AcuC n=1 Tax=Arthrobacter sp. RIT-PI-e TaxID=1681197 RepID=UPI000676A96B|nr:acetoin utilization protein AcuC [Arthrobacter sp. RIT-PI-e]KNC20303.1 acetoin utilization protein AcuC [Arthrobacter sp. RIT-PI-e]
MSTRTGAAVPLQIVWDDSMLAYDFGGQHPMNPERLHLTSRLVRACGLLDLDGVSVAAPEVATDDELETVHSAEYVRGVRSVSANPDLSDAVLGLGTEDTPAFLGMHEASARLAGGSIGAADALSAGSVVRAVNFGGGMHHAARSRASGFCIYNDAAASVQRLLDRGARRVLYIDVDAHHGDGTQSIFWDDSRVMTISLHETGMSLFPGTGFADETGGAGAEGYAVNVALPTTAGDSAVLRAFHAVVPQLAGAFAPDVIVSQHGCDSHREDPLTNLRVSVDAQHAMMVAVRELADRLCEGRWLATGGGGYALTSVVPRSWALLVAVAAGSSIGPSMPVPGEWRGDGRARHGTEAPLLMGDDVDLWWRSWEVGYDPDDDLDRTVMATRKALFPLHGLDPWFD